MSETIQLFITCILDTLYPQIGQSVVEVLNKAGCQVEFPGGQTCCGQPAFNAGMRQQTHPVAMHTIRVFEATRGPIVIPSGSCAHMLRHSYAELFAEDAEWLPRAQALAERCYEFSEFLVDHLRVVDVGAQYPGKLAYHSSCHLLRGLGVDRQPRALLNAVKDAQIVELPYSDECCGFGGIFSVKHPQVSTAMLARKIANIEASGAPLIVSGDAGCVTNINGGLHRQGKPQRAVHIAEILAGRATRG